METTGFGSVSKEVDDFFKENSPDILVTSASIDLDAKDDKGRSEDEKKESEEKEHDKQKERKEKEQVADNKDEDVVEGKTSTSSEPEFLDFSVLELPESSQLNVELSKQRRTLSKKGSFARRKRPTRAAILSTGSENEDSLYQDSTEPKQPKHEDEEKPKEEEDEAFTNEGASVSEKKESPGKKMFGGIKIPGLLDGLSKAKPLRKSPSKSPTEPEKEMPSAAKTTSSPVSSQPAAKPTPSVQPKPLALPRVLPRPSVKGMKDSQNHSTAEENLKPSALKDSSTAEGLKKLPSSEGEFNKAVGATKVIPPIGSKVTSPSETKASEPVESKTASLFGPKVTSPTKPGVTLPGEKAKTPPAVASKPAPPTKPKRFSMGGLSSAAKPSDKPTTTADSVISSSKGSNVFAQKPGTVEKLKPLEPVSTARLGNKENGQTEKKPLADKPNYSEFLEKSRNKLKPIEMPSFMKTSNSPVTKDNDTITSPKSGCDTAKPFDSQVSKDKDVPAQNRDQVESPSATEDMMKPRKQSFSGITPVKSPSVNKPATGSVPRKNSIQGSAYNPIGFRSAMGSTSSESDPKSRGNSVSSLDGGAVVLGMSNSRARDGSVNSSDGKPAQAGSGKATEEPLSPDVFSSSPAQSSDQLKKEPSWLTDAKSGLQKTAPGKEGNHKETAEEKNRLIRDGKASKEPTPSKPSGVTENGDSEQKKSPWGVSLRKVERKEATPPPEEAKEKSTPMNWRQQLSQKKKNPLIPKEPEKSHQDAPEWAKASSERRKRLMNAGLIDADAK